jgi:hypothetical protein
MLKNKCFMSISNLFSIDNAYEQRFTHIINQTIIYMLIHLHAHTEGESRTVLEFWCTFCEIILYEVPFQFLNKS